MGAKMDDSGEALVNSDQLVTECDKSQHPSTYITERHTFYHHTTAVATLWLIVQAGIGAESYPAVACFWGLLGIYECLGGL